MLLNLLDLRQPRAVDRMLKSKNQLSCPVERPVCLITQYSFLCFCIQEVCSSLFCQQGGTQQVWCDLHRDAGAAAGSHTRHHFESETHKSNRSTKMASVMRNYLQPDEDIKELYGGHTRTIKQQKLLRMVLITFLVIVLVSLLEQGDLSCFDLE